jgi:RNA polymerase sigma factor (TIGR02999 family)
MDGERHWDNAVYEKLRRSAHSLCRRERLLFMLQPTAVLHEAFLRVRGYAQPASVSDHIRLVQRVMRNVLVDHVRRIRSLRRGGPGAVRVELTEDLAPVGPVHGELFDLIDRLARVSPRQARVFRLRGIEGFEVAEVARILGISARTVKTEWSAAKQWLAQQLESNAA